PASAVGSSREHAKQLKRLGCPSLNLFPWSRNQRAWGREWLVDAKGDTNDHPFENCCRCRRGSDADRRFCCDRPGSSCRFEIRSGRCRRDRHGCAACFGRLRQRVLRSRLLCASSLSLGETLRRLRLLRRQSAGLPLSDVETRSALAPLPPSADLLGPPGNVPAGRVFTNTGRLEAVIGVEG